MNKLKLIYYKLKLCHIGIKLYSYFIIEKYIEKYRKYINN